MNQLGYALTHIPEVVLPLFHAAGPWGYLIIFLITFTETGLVFFPWLPGESLIFVTASLAALPQTPLRMAILVPGFFLAALLGDMVNYTIGTRLTRWPWLARHLGGPAMERARTFFTRHGIKAIIFGRFVPLIRTFVPLIAGSAGMRPGRFIVGNLLGTALWVGLAAGAGYYLGTIPFVKDHFSALLLALIAALTLPMLIFWGLNRLRRHLIAKRKML